MLFASGATHVASQGLDGNRLEVGFGLGLLELGFGVRLSVGWLELVLTVGWPAHDLVVGMVGTWVGVTCILAFYYVYTLTLKLLYRIFKVWSLRSINYIC